MWLITLVHGTFAAQAPWSRPTSPFAAAIRDGLANQGEPVEVTTFDWTGNNTHEARENAARELAAQLDDNVKRQPRVRHVFICHSHGGNIALRALQCTPARPDAVVTLGTPFIHCDARDLDWAAEHWWIVGPFVWSVVILGPTVALALAGVLKAMPLIEAELLRMVVCIAGLAIAIAVGRRGLQYLETTERETWWPALRTWQERVLARLSLIENRGADVPTLACFVARDEAALWLSILATIGELPHRVSRVVLPLGTLALASIPFLTLIGAVVGWGDGFTTVGTILLVAGVVPAMILTPLLFVVPWAIRGHVFGFGGEHILDNAVVRIWANRCPPTRAQLTEVKPFGRLRHSGFYSDERVSSLICAWLTKTVSRRSVAPRVS